MLCLEILYTNQSMWNLFIYTFLSWTELNAEVKEPIRTSKSIARIPEDLYTLWCAFPWREGLSFRWEKGELIHLWEIYPSIKNSRKFLKMKTREIVQQKKEVKFQKTWNKKFLFRVSLFSSFILWIFFLGEILFFFYEIDFFHSFKIQSLRVHIPVL